MWVLCKWPWVSRFTSLRSAHCGHRSHRVAGLGGCPTGPPVGGVTSTSTPVLCSPVALYLLQWPPTSLSCVSGVAENAKTGTSSYCWPCLAGNSVIILSTIQSFSIRKALINKRSSAVKVTVYTTVTSLMTCSYFRSINKEYLSTLQIFFIDRLTQRDGIKNRAAATRLLSCILIV